MASQTDVQVECGFCVSKLEDLTDPRCLPCGHIYCLECLLGDFEVNKILKCPFCREVFDLKISSLPSSTTREDSALCCDTCIRKGETNQSAVVYCKTCTAKFCAKHKESHDDLMGAHPMINMTEYRTQTIKLEPRLCSEHTTLPYSLGCRSCLIVACTKCVGALDNCTADSPLHKLMSLDELVAELAKEMDKVRSDMMDREDKLSDVFKRMTGVLCDYDNETRDMIETLHRTRDEQIESIRLKYKNLEEELVKLREDVKLRLERFTEQDLGSSLADLHRHRLQIEARHKHNHQVDLINKHVETMKEMEKLLAAEFPALQVSNMASLQIEGKRRDIEVNVVTSIHKFTDFEKTIADSSHKATMSNTLQEDTTSDSEASFLHILEEQDTDWETASDTSDCWQRGCTELHGERADISGPFHCWGDSRRIHKWGGDGWGRHKRGGERGRHQSGGGRGVHNRGKERGGHNKGGERGGHNKSGERGGHNKVGERGEHKKGGERGGHNKGGERGGHNKGGERGGHNKGGERGGHNKGGERGGHNKGGERGGHNKGGERGGHNKGGERGGHNKGEERGGHNKGGERGGHNKGGERGGHNKGGERGGHNEGGERGGHNKGGERGEHKKGGERGGHNKGGERGGHNKGGERGEHTGGKKRATGVVEKKTGAGEKSGRQGGRGRGRGYGVWSKMH